MQNLAFYINHVFCKHCRNITCVQIQGGSGDMDSSCNYSQHGTISPRNFLLGQGRLDRSAVSVRPNQHMDHRSAVHAGALSSRGQLHRGSRAVGRAHSLFAKGVDVLCPLVRSDVQVSDGMRHNLSHGDACCRFSTAFFVACVQIDNLLRSENSNWKKQLMDLELSAGFLIAQFSAGSLRGRRFSEGEQQLVSLIKAPLFRGGLEANETFADTPANSLFLKSMIKGEGSGAVFLSKVTAEAPIKRMFARTLKEVRFICTNTNA